MPSCNLGSDRASYITDKNQRVHSISPNIVNILPHLITLLFSWFLFAAAALPFIIMTIVFKPYQRGVYCDDESIMYPLRPDTITHGMLAAVTISCTVIIVSFAQNVGLASLLTGSFYNVSPQESEKCGKFTGLLSFNYVLCCVLHY